MMAGLVTCGNSAGFSGSSAYICVLMLLYMCPHTTIYVLAGLPAAIGPGSLAALHSTLFLPLHSDASGYVCVCVCVCVKETETETETETEREREREREREYVYICVCVCVYIYMYIYMYI